VSPSEKWRTIGEKRRTVGTGLSGELLIPTAIPCTLTPPWITP